MKKLLGLLGITAAMAWTFSGAALAGPISSCGVVSGHIECDLYETDSIGNPTEIGDIITLPLTPVGTGVVLILEPGGSASDRTTWSDELIFTSTTVQLISDGCNSGIEGDISCFSTDFGTNIIFEDATGFAVWDVGNIYRVHSDGEAPEPATLALVGLALAGLGVVRRRRTQN